MKKSRMILRLIWILFSIISAGGLSLADDSALPPKPNNPSASLEPAKDPAENKSEANPILQEEVPLNPEVRLEVSDNVSKVFRDMVVVQRKAKSKAKHILFSPNLGVDFADGPATLYTMNLNLGYAVNDFWEVYFNYAPGFIVQERGIVRMLASEPIYRPDPNVDGACLDLDVDGQCDSSIFRLGYARPKNQIGAEVLWAPAYGKDSWGPYTMFRSDTFFKIGAYQVDFPEINKKGLRFSFMGGKTYFAAKYFNVRVAAGLHQMQTFVGNTEADRQRFNTILFLEGGLVFYL